MNNPADIFYVPCSSARTKLGGAANGRSRHLGFASVPSPAVCHSPSCCSVHVPGIPVANMGTVRIANVIICLY